MVNNETEFEEVVEMKKKIEAPAPIKAIGNWFKAHWKGLAIGAGVAGTAALVSYVKGFSDALDNDIPEEDLIESDAEEVFDNETAETDEEEVSSES